MQIQVLIAEKAIVRGTAEGPNTGPSIEMAKPLVFNRKASRVKEFITVYRLYLDERSNSRRVGIIDIIICIKRIGRYMKGEYIKEFRIRRKNRHTGRNYSENITG